MFKFICSRFTHVSRGKERVGKGKRKKKGETVESVEWLQGREEKGVVAPLLHAEGRRRPPAMNQLI